MVSWRSTPLFGNLRHASAFRSILAWQVTDVKPNVGGSKKSIYQHEHMIAEVKQ
jgi:hypothetical protein